VLLADDANGMAAAIVEALGDSQMRLALGRMAGHGLFRATASKSGWAG
jgi:hypothetical protein